ncbi:LacI family DNA-binding transcriptional regulator [Rhizobium helianthi]|uniref:LacI family DNA-binding transcriptional regulator n=1 Tax=Rhizobium helianthi TaxID=1132695 RepID=A0ABW4M6M2_9HYPH
MKPTVHDIAAHAGVSLATVDRVLNGRAGVRAPTRERVEAAISALGFVRDVAAANLAKGRIYRFTFILPANDNSFMIGLRRQVEEAIQWAGRERVSIRIVDVPAFDDAALAAALEQAGEDAIDGIAFVAVDSGAVRDVVERLAERGTILVTLVSDLAGSRRHHFAGIDNIAAGQTAATLMCRFLGARSGKILPIAGSLQVQDHRDRLKGFSDHVARSYPCRALLPVVEGADNPERVAALLREALRHREDIAGIYSFGAGNRGLLTVLEEGRGQEAPVVIVHELTEISRQGLLGGRIDAVLNQDAGHEVRSALRVLKAGADGAALLAAQERIRIDIFLKENLP